MQIEAICRNLLTYQTLPTSVKTQHANWGYQPKTTDVPPISSVSTDANWGYLPKFADTSNTSHMGSFIIIFVPRNNLIWFLDHLTHSKLPLLISSMQMHHYSTSRSYLACFSLLMHCPHMIYNYEIDIIPYPWTYSLSSTRIFSWGFIPVRNLCPSRRLRSDKNDFHLQQGEQQPGEGLLRFLYF